MYLTPQDWEREAERRAGQQEQPATAPASPQPAPAPQATAPQQSGPGPERQAAETAEEQSRDEGLVTQIGETLDYLLTDGNLSSDALNGIANLLNQISGGNLQGLDDAVKGSQEIKEAQEGLTQERVERLQNNEGQLGDRAVVALTGVSEGAQAGVAMPLTIAARISNQDAPWSDPPAAIKGSPLGETAFAITEILTPTLLTGGVTTGYGMTPSASAPLALTAESALETATQDSATDLLGGKELAIQTGRLATALGFDGEQLTIDLIEGRKPNAQAMVAIAGFFQNLSINFGADQLLRKIGKFLPNAGNDEVVETIAKKTGKSKEEVVEQLDLFNDPKYSYLREPHETVDIDSMAAVGKPTDGNKYINEPMLQEQLLKRRGLASDGLAQADRDYFTNFKSVSGEAGLVEILEEATKGLQKLRPSKTDIDQMAIQARAFIDEYTDAATGNIDIDEALIHFPELVVPIGKSDGSIYEMSAKQLLRQSGRVDEEGYIVGAILAEEVGLRMQMAAKGAVNLDTAGIDFTKQVENFLELSDKAHDVLIPLRRGKRYWSTIGSIQQRSVIEGLTDPSQMVGKNIRDEAETVIQQTTKDQAQTVRQLWDAYKGGDVEAGKTLKDYMGLIAASRPRTALANVENLTTALRAELKRGNADAYRSLYYSYMLTRLSPQVASLGSNILQLIKLPIGTWFTGNKAQAYGQFVGGFAAQMDGIANALQAFKTGKGINTGSKVPQNLLSLKQKDAQLDRAWEALREQMVRDKVPAWEQMTAKLMYWRQKMSHMPGMDIAMRGLLATDEWGKTVFAAQVATGRAYQQAADAGWKIPRRLKDGTPEFQSLIQDSLNEAFTDGRRSMIRDPEILEGAKRITFQSDIPSGGNIIDQAFKGLDDAAKDSVFWNWVSPFTRVSYNTLEAGGILLASSVPVVGKKALVELIPRYKKILAGEMGEIAQMQLKSDIAFGEYTAYLWGGLASLGMMTGQQPPEGLPRTSFIIPSPLTETGYIAIPYARMEPIATPMAIIADLVTAIRDDVISEGDYSRAMERVLTGMALASVDKSFTQGMLNTAEMFDVRQWSDYTMNQTIRALAAPVAGGVIPTGAYGGLARMVGSWVNPSKTVNRVQDRPIENLWLAISSTVWGGGGVAPVMYDPLTGKPQMRTATVGGNDNWWGAVAGTFFNELVFPGKVQDAKRDEIQDNFNRVNFDFSMDNLRSINGISLSAEQISMLSQDLHTEGKLSQRLTAYFNSPRYKNKIEKLEALRGTNPTGNTGDGTTAGSIREEIHIDIRGVLTEATHAAVRNGRLGKDPDYLRRRESRRTGVPLNQIPEPMMEDDTQNLPLIPTR
jgi:hypothetical protein